MTTGDATTTGGAGEALPEHVARNRAAWASRWPCEEAWKVRKRA